VEKFLEALLGDYNALVKLSFLSFSLWEIAGKLTGELCPPDSVNLRKSATAACREKEI
jgi:hypothetical protein